MASSERAATPLRSLGLFSVLCIGINAIVGSGIYKLPGRIAFYLGGASWLAFAIVGLLLIAVGLCFAEMSGMFDASGGPYVYAREAFGKGFAFVVGWMAWVTMVVSWAAVASGVVTYLSLLMPSAGDPTQKRLVIAALIAVPGMLNYFGVKPGAYATNVFTIAKLVPLVLFVAIGLPAVDWSRVSALPDMQTASFGALGSALFVALFAVQGFEVAPVPAGETKNPRRNVPIAVIGSLIGCAIFYVLIQIVAYGTAPSIATAAADAPREVHWSTEPLADSARSFFGAHGATFMALGACISMAGFCVGSALATPRFLGVLAEDGLFPAWLAQRHHRFGSPHRAIVFTTVVTLLWSQALDFDRLIDFANVAVTLQYAATCLALIWLRRRKPDAARGYRVPGGPYVVPIVGILVCAMLVTQAKPTEWITSAVVIVVGALFALAGRALFGKKETTNE